MKPSRRLQYALKFRLRVWQCLNLNLGECKQAGQARHNLLKKNCLDKTEIIFQFLVSKNRKKDFLPNPFVPTDLRVSGRFQSRPNWKVSFFSLNKQIVIEMFFGNSQLETKSYNRQLLCLGTNWERNREHI